MDVSSGSMLIFQGVSKLRWKFLEKLAKFGVDPEHHKRYQLLSIKRFSLLLDIPSLPYIK